MSNSNQIPPSLQSLFSGAWAQAMAGAANPAAAATLAVPGFPGMPLTPGMPNMSTMTAPEAGWWWLPAVKPELLQAAVSKWFSPTMVTRSPSSANLPTPCSGGATAVNHLLAMSATYRAQSRVLPPFTLNLE